jgi:hypothetical protein
MQKKQLIDGDGGAGGLPTSLSPLSIGGSIFVILPTVFPVPAGGDSITSNSGDTSITGICRTEED